jgi:hypothetical protein
MKKLFLIGLLISGALMLTAAQSKGARYVSTWTYVPPAQAVNFEHALSTRPLEVDIWVAHFAGKSDKQCQADFTEVLPIYEVETLEVITVTPEKVLVYNHDDIGYCVQVVAVP